MSEILSREEFEKWCASPTGGVAPTRRARATIEALAEALVEADDCLSRRGGHEEWATSELAAKRHEEGWL